LKKDMKGIHMTTPAGMVCGPSTSSRGLMRSVPSDDTGSTRIASCVSGT